jgi:hypothetical protein
VKRRHLPRPWKDADNGQPGETWAQWMQRIMPKEMAAARRRRRRQVLEWRWPGVRRVKTEYRRRRR